MNLADRSTVRAEYASEQAFLRRSVYANAVYEGPDPREHALLAVHEGRPARLLDVGCGTGELAARAAHVLGCDVVGVDQSERMVELAREAGVEAHVADVERLPFEDGAFDAVTATWVLYHLPDVDIGLAEIDRVLRPGGRLVALHNGVAHLVELWGRDESAFARRCEEAARRRFAHVEQRDVRGTAVFATRGALRSYVIGFANLHGRDETDRAGTASIPLRVSCHNVVLVAEKA